MLLHFNIFALAAVILSRAMYVDVELLTCFVHPIDDQVNVAAAVSVGLV